MGDTIKTTITSKGTTMKDYNQLHYVVHALLSDIANNPNNEGIFECLYNGQIFKVQYAKCDGVTRVVLRVLLNDNIYVMDNFNTDYPSDFFIRHNHMNLLYNTSDNTLEVSDASHSSRVMVTLPETPKDDFLLFCKKFVTTK